MGDQEDRPYRYMSELQIQQHIRSLESASRQWLREARRLDKIGAYEDADAERANANANDREAIGYYAELKARERDRAEKDRVRKEQREAAAAAESANANAGAPPDASGLSGLWRLVDSHLARWARDIGPMENIALTSLTLSWSWKGRHFRGEYLPQGHGLRVWVQVPAGTAGSTELDGTSYLPANNRSEYGRADEAAKRATRPGRRPAMPPTKANL